MKVVSKGKGDMPDDEDAPLLPFKRKRGRPARIVLLPQASEETYHVDTSSSDSECSDSSCVSSDEDADFSAEQGVLKKGPKKPAKKKSTPPKQIPLVRDLGPGSDSGNSDISGPDNDTEDEEEPDVDDSTGASQFNFLRDHPCANPLPDMYEHTSEGIPLMRPGSSAVSCFNKVFPLSLWEHIAEETNIYAADYWHTRNKQLKRVHAHTHTHTHTHTHPHTHTLTHMHVAQLVLHTATHTHAHTRTHTH